MHAVVIAVIFTAYVTLMGVIFWCLAGQLRGSDDDTPGPGMKCDLL